MSKALIAGINQVASDKGLDKEVIFEAIEAALVSAYKRNYGAMSNVTAEVDRASGDMRVFAEQEVVDEVVTPRTEIALEQAIKVYPQTQVGDLVKVESNPDDFGRIAAQTAKQVIIQRIREAEKETTLDEYREKEGEILSGIVQKVDRGNVFVDLGRTVAIIMREDQIAGEFYRPGERIRAYLYQVEETTRGINLRLSRSHPQFIARLVETEAPEISSGVVEIKAIAREAELADRRAARFPAPPPAATATAPHRRTPDPARRRRSRGRSARRTRRSPRTRPPWGTRDAERFRALTRRPRGAARVHGDRPGSGPPTGRTIGRRAGGGAGGSRRTRRGGREGRAIVCPRPRGVRGRPAPCP